MSKQKKSLEAITRSPKDIHVLLVDDEQDQTEVLQRSLVRLGYQVTVHNDPLKALKSFKPGRFDIAIIDIRMPVMNGFQLLKRLKKIDINLRACLLTAFELIEEDMASNQIAPNSIECYMKKPIHISEFTKKVTSMLEDTR